MSVRTNLGKIKSAMQEGRKAYSNIDFGPSLPASIRDRNSVSVDFWGENVNPNLFISGIHKCGDIKHRVAK